MKSLSESIKDINEEEINIKVSELKANVDKVVNKIINK